MLKYLGREGLLQGIWRLTKKETFEFETTMVWLEQICNGHRRYIAVMQEELQEDVGLWKKLNKKEDYK